MTQAEENANAKIIFNFFSPADILGPRGAIAAVVNAFCEASLNPAALGDKGEAFGLWQLHANRTDPIKIATGIDLTQFPDVLSQCKAIWWELNETEKHARDAIRAAKDSFDATAAWCSRFERPAKDETGRRGAMAATWTKFFNVAD